MSLTDLQIVTLVQKYARERDRFEKMAATVARHLSARLRAVAVPHVPTFRGKDPESLRGKLKRDCARHDFCSFEHEFAPQILDLAGVRVMLYRPRDVAPTCLAIEDLFEVQPEARFRRDHMNAEGYQARHRVVALRDEWITSDPALLNLRGVLCEVQVVTLGEIIWNELEHDIIYKTPLGRPTETQDALLKTLRTQLDGVRETVNRLMDATERQRAENLSVIEFPEDLRQALRVCSGRMFAGDFSRMLKLLAAVLREVTPAELHKLPLASADLDRGRARIAKAGMSVATEDLTVVLGALWPLHGPDFLEVVKTWPGKPGQITRVVRALNEAQEQGKL